MMRTPKAMELQDPVRDLILRANAITQNKLAFDPSAANRRFRLMMSD